MKYVVNEEKKTESSVKVNKTIKNNRLKPLKTAIIAFLIFTVILGLGYTLSVTVFAQVLFPYEANGSVIEVTLKDGSKRNYGSELIGQSYLKIDNNGNHILIDNDENQYVTNGEDIYYLDVNKNNVLDSDETTKLSEETKTTVMFEAKYLVGRFNQGAPSNSSPTTDIYKETLESRKEALVKIGYNEAYNETHGFKGIPSELITESGSGVDPEVTYESALYQVPLIASARGISEEEVKQIIDNHTINKFLGIFGSKRVNVLLVNLELDGLI